MNSHKNTKYNKESFIKIAKETHLDNFEYENINYISYLKMSKELTRRFQWIRSTIADSLKLDENFVNVNAILI